MRKETNIKDIFCGEVASTWSDTEFVYLNIHCNAVTVVFTKEEFELFKKEMKEIK